MYIAIISDEEGKTVLQLQSESRKAMRSLYELCTENKLPCTVTVEAKPRVVKFKNVATLEQSDEAQQSTEAEKPKKKK